MKNLYLVLVMAIGIIFISVEFESVSANKQSFVNQYSDPTPSRAVYGIELGKILMEIGETTEVQVSLHTAEGCTYGAYVFDLKVIDENGYESSLLQKIAGEDYPLPNSPSASVWQAEELGRVKLVASSFGEGACAPTYPSLPPPFFNANAGGSSQSILIVDKIYRIFIPIITQP